jgi:hypothetical protein
LRIRAEEAGFVVLWPPMPGFRQMQRIFGDISMSNLKGKTTAAILAALLFAVSAGFAQTLEDNWENFLHFTAIGRLELAEGYAQAVLDNEPNAVDLQALSERNPQGYAILLKVVDSARATDPPPSPELVELAQVSEKLLEIIEQGKFHRRSDPRVIVAEIERLSGTARGRIAAVKRLKNAGEYAIPYMVDAMADSSRKEELPDIVWALPQIGRDAIRPLAAALQTKNMSVKAEIIKAMGGIGYPQSLAYLKYIAENDSSGELRKLASRSIRQIDAAGLKIPAAELFFRLADNYYYHLESLAPAEDADFANIWFWDADNQRLVSERVDRSYFYELMAMRVCERALKANPGYGQAIGLWLAAFFKAESAGVEQMPDYFGPGHADAMTYATTAGPEYLHQALARAIKDEDAYVALGAVEALATTAGERSLLYRLGVSQPLVQALSFHDKAVRFSAAIAIAAAGPKQMFAESRLVVENLAQALARTSEQVTEYTDLWNEELANSYALRAAEVMLELAQTRNPVIDLFAAQGALINATTDKRTALQILAGRILAHFNSADAQRSIAAMALAEKNAMGVRIAAFKSLAVSAKLNASLLNNETIDAIYLLVSSPEVNPGLRSAAAAAYGALNLPSQKVKDLILDQARS